MFVIKMYTLGQKKYEDFCKDIFSNKLLLLHVAGLMRGYIWLPWIKIMTVKCTFKNHDTKSPPENQH